MALLALLHAGGTATGHAAGTATEHAMQHLMELCSGNTGLARKLCNRDAKHVGLHKKE